MEMHKSIFAAVAAICTAAAFADLPSGYRQLDYVDTDGSQWVNTLFRPTCTNAVEMKASVSDFSSINCLYCTRRTASNRTYTLLIGEGTGKPRFDYQAKSVTCSTPLVAGVPYVFAASPSEDDGQDEVAETSKEWTMACTIDGITVATVEGEYFTVDSKAYFCLFGSYQSSAGTAAVLNDDTTVGNLASCRFYYFKVWDTKDKGTLMCHVVPAYGEAEQAIGLYDLVAGRFLPVHGGTLSAPKIVSSNVVLTANEDWSSSSVMIADGVAVDLNGHDLIVANVGTNAVSAQNPCYQNLPYIQATGAQALKFTGFRLPGTAKVEMKIRPSVLSGTQWLFCSRAGAKNNTYSALLGDSGSFRFDFYNEQTVTDTKYPAGSDYEMVFDGSTATPTWYVNGNQEKAHGATSNSFTSGGDLFLLGSSLSGTFSGRLYYFTVTTNNVAMLDLHPVRRISDGVAGLYDRVGNSFYASGTATDLLAPANVPKFGNTSETTSELRVGQELMPGYTVVDRISATDSFIKTEYVPDATDRLELKASLSDVSTTHGLFCSRKSATSEMFAALFTTGGVRFDFNAGAGEQKTTSFKPAEDEVFTVVLDGGEKACYTNGAVAATFASNDFTPTATVYLFALHANNGSSSARAPGSIYWFKVRGADGTLKVDMVPAVRDSDSVAGLYDRARRKFYSSANGNAFTTGTQVGDGKLYVDADCAFDATEIAGNITLVKNGEGAFDGGGSTLAGTLKPVSGTVGGVTMQDGATLDLSALSDAFSLDDNAVSFADGASITIDLGSRTASSRSPLVSWTVPPANLGTLKFIRAAGATRGFVVKSDGIYLAPKGLIISFF